MSLIRCVLKPRQSQGPLPMRVGRGRQGGGRGLGVGFRAGQTFRTTAEAEGEGFYPV